ncbi:hypothetical protein ES689_09835 [Frigoribacterium sp. ACAM 257]|uniref:hypothetical protein n=1 Tax=Frigoribacterium sp. ACAM 257 TaxID=2508998 RepID=UPI0011BA368A|nr:hypothetical protein [Frigoribacterium sp. ACAM 257]TWX38886.1 hypothetical protein ES689_09835 [Frigoribacterium sp. ACAM 257]
MTDPTSDPAAGADDAAGAADRRAELIAAALASDLSGDEAVELDALRVVDPTVDDEIASLGGVVARLEPVGAWQDAPADTALLDRVESAVARDGAVDAAERAEPAAAARRAEQADPSGRAEEAAVAPGAPAPRPGDASAPVVPLRPRRSRRLALTVLGAAACVAVGVGGGVLAATPRDAHVAGPPGTLGAVEPVAFGGEPSGVAVDGDLVAHTWGTETVLTVDGLPTGEAFSVVVVDDTGAEHESGAFLGTDVTIDCRMNAAVLREHVVSVEVRGADGAEIATASVPSVDA